jgi:hypothetical protein
MLLSLLFFEAAAKELNYLEGLFRSKQGNQSEQITEQNRVTRFGEFSPNG